MRHHLTPQQFESRPKEKKEFKKERNYQSVMHTVLRIRSCVPIRILFTAQYLIMQYNTATGTHDSFMS